MVGLVTILALANFAFANHLHPRQSSSGATVDINTLSKTVNSTGGTGQVAAAGTLNPFGDIGVGCGINWAEGVSYGGEWDEGEFP